MLAQRSQPGASGLELELRVKLELESKIQVRFQDSKEDMEGTTKLPAENDSAVLTIGLGSFFCKNVTVQLELEPKSEFSFNFSFVFGFNLEPNTGTTNQRKRRPRPSQNLTEGTSQPTFRVLNVTERNVVHRSTQHGRMLRWYGAYNSQRPLIRET